MSLSVIVGWGIAAAIAVVAFLYARRMDKDLAETELLRAGLRARAEEYRKAGTASAFKDQYFSLAAADTEQTNDEIEGYRRKAKTNDEIEGYRRKAIVGEQEGRALKTLGHPAMFSRNAESSNNLPGSMSSPSSSN
jgi:hypothetical protein